MKTKELEPNQEPLLKAPTKILANIIKENILSEESIQKYREQRYLAIVILAGKIVIKEDISN